MAGSPPCSPPVPDGEVLSSSVGTRVRRRRLVPRSSGRCSALTVRREFPLLHTPTGSAARQFSRKCRLSQVARSSQFRSGPGSCRPFPRPRCALVAFSLRIIQSNPIRPNPIRSGFAFDFGFDFASPRLARDGRRAGGPGSAGGGAPIPLAWITPPKLKPRSARVSAAPR